MSEPDPRPTVIVIGAINVDLVVAGAPLPGPGETVVGGSFARHHGGKGGNQAVAAARALTGGGRVLTVVGRGATLAEARATAYRNVERISFERMQYRRDIGAEG